MQWLYKASEGVLAWTYYGSAAPFTDIKSENCELVGDNNEDFVCAALGVGFIILEVLLPVLLVYIAWTQLSQGLKKIGYAVIIWVGYLIGYTVDFVLFIIKAIES